MNDIWNPWHGCKKYSEGCEHCYMYYLDSQRDKDGSEIYNSDTIECKDINKVDLYALGVVLFNLAFGSYPYNLENGDEDNEETIKLKLKSDFVQ